MIFESNSTEIQDWRNMSADVLDKEAEIVLRKIYSKLNGFNFQNDLKSKIKLTHNIYTQKIDSGHITAMTIPVVEFFIVIVSKYCFSN
jgi:hypothetical protein